MTKSSPGSAKTTRRFIQYDSFIFSVDVPEGRILKEIPPAIYTIGKSQQGYFLQREKMTFPLPKKIFGGFEKRATKIINTFEDRPTSTGVLLYGDKGSGKTLLAEIVSNKVLAKGVPVVLVNTPFGDQDFLSFIDSLGPVCLIFDEFGKKYPTKRDEDSSFTQEDLLTLFDGTSRNKRLVILTENELYKINQFMNARPGRVYYSYNYKKLGEDVIDEYLKHNSIDEEIFDKIMNLYNQSRVFNFDMLQAIIEEYKRYGDFDEAVKDLNLGQTGDRKTKVEIISITDADRTNFFRIRSADKIQSVDLSSRSGYRDFSLYVDKNPQRIIDDEIESKKAFIARKAWDKIDRDTEWVSVSSDNIKFMKGDFIVYESEGYVITCKSLDTGESIDWNSYMQRGGFGSPMQTHYPVM